MYTPKRPITVIKALFKFLLDMEILIDAANLVTPP